MALHISKNAGAEELRSALDEAKNEAGATDSIAEPFRFSHGSQAAVGDVTGVKLTPKPVTFTEKDWPAVKAYIESQEAAHPGSVTLEQIRELHLPAVPDSPQN